MPKDPVNILCMKWGTKYDVSYVNKLHSMVSRNLSLPFRFICLTDDDEGLNQDIESFPIPEVQADLEDSPGRKRVQAWKKLLTFSPRLYDVEGTCLFLDVDIVLLDNIDCFFELEGEFFIIRDWIEAESGEGNSSVYRFEAGELSKVLGDFIENRDQIVEQYHNEQAYLTDKLKEMGKLQYWPADWCLSFRHNCMSKNRLKRWFFPTPKPDKGKILVFHGAPNPAEAIAGTGDRWYRRLAPTKWIEEYWK